MRADVGAAQRVALVAPPGAGKSAELAVRAVAAARAGRVVAVCSHPSSCGSLFAHVRALDAHAAVEVGELADVLATMLRADARAAGVRADVSAGDGQAARAAVRIAAQGLLALEWPELADGRLSIDVPLISHPDDFLDAAAELFGLLHQLGEDPEAFERGCHEGAAAFYGADVERAVARCAEPDVRRAASRRGRLALTCSETSLREQREAEARLAALLAKLYREYDRAVRGLGTLPHDAVVDIGLRFLADDAALRRAFEGITALLVDDAEDAHPRLPAFVRLAERAGVPTIVVAGHNACAVDGMSGRRSALRALADFADASLPAPARDGPRAMRYADAAAEREGIAAWLRERLGAGDRPDDLAVLTRADDVAAGYARDLTAMGLPVVPPSGVLTDLDGALDLVALGAVVTDPQDAAHLLRVLSSPLLGLSDATLALLCADEGGPRQLMLDVLEPDDDEHEQRARPRPDRGRFFDNVLRGKADAALSPAARDRLVRFRSHIETWRADAAGMDPDAVLRMLDGRAGFRARRAYAPAHLQARLANDIERLCDAARRIAADEPRAPFLALTAGLRERTASLRPARRVAGAIACESIVGAKGVRWRHVAVVGLGHERFPRVYVSRPLAYARGWGLLVRENTALGAAQTAKFAWYYARHGAKRRYLDDERRALRYAIGRADGSAFVTGFGRPPGWAAAHDLLAELGA